jgi:metallo-beta-lactamase class B
VINDEVQMKELIFKKAFILCTAAMFFLSAQTFGQELPEKLPTKEDLANNNKLFLELASKALKWDHNF